MRVRAPLDDALGVEVDIEALLSVQSKCGDRSQRDVGDMVGIRIRSSCAERVLPTPRRQQGLLVIMWLQTFFRLSVV